MEKKEQEKYERPVMDVVKLDDIITTSGGNDTCCDGRCDTFG